MTIGDRIKKYRIECGYTQQEVASKLGSTAQAVSKYESGVVTNIPLDKIEALADLFGCSPCELVGCGPTSVPQSDATAPEEVQLLETYQRLNEEGQARLSGYIDCLASLEKYARDATLPLP